ncbi:ribbon-helix-helix domain-containing protein [Acutalibacter muris]|uniref:ribbon-helix-helix domain-containing protein n=1 Tax=Acutalibacter muris TaxID=1796620 RepID=UPI001C3EA605|nr:ribbon-helix-helix domain-containing protein [Acutalibacter muris]
MATEKRKTETSSAVKRRYNQKTYGAVTAYVPKDLATAFKAKCAAEGISQAQIIKKAIEDFLNS